MEKETRNRTDLGWCMNGRAVLSEPVLNRPLSRKEMAKAIDLTTTTRLVSIDQFLLELDLNVDELELSKGA